MGISIDRRRWATIAITLGLAFASGYVMQNVLAAREPEPEAAPAADAIRATEAAAVVPELRAPPILAGRTREARPRIEAAGCIPRLFVNPAPAGMVRIDLYAPCQRTTPVSLRQNGVAVRLATDNDGRLHVRMPALSVTPEIELDLDGHPMSAALVMPDADANRHVALVWDGPQALRINAYEFGASKADMGHVWAGSPKSTARALRGAGGFLTLLGDGDGPMAEIYSFPADGAGTPGVVRLDVEAEVTAANCGREVAAEALQPGATGGLVRTRVALAMPGCDRAGETLRLQNLFRDMRLAGR